MATVMNARARVVVADPLAETFATQVLALALLKVAERLSKRVDEGPRLIPLPPLLAAASRVMSLASLGAPNPPIEVLALAARNTFEIFLRLRHIFASDAQSVEWRNEAASDHLEVYEGILGLGGPESIRAAIAEEMQRIQQHAAAKGLVAGARHARVDRLARDTGLESEYKAFYKLYSKFVHPSSFVVNQPSAAAAPAFRSILIFNLQLYGHLLLDELETAFGVSAEALLQEANRQLAATLK